MEMVTLNDGNKIPAVGFGVFLIPNDGATYEAVTRALKAGYRHIDTAAAYFNEAEVGKAVKDSGIPREEILSQANSGSRIMDMKQQRKVLKHLWKNWGLTM